MNILIYGGGAVGIGIATALIKSGCNVDIIARGKTVELLREHGIERRGIFGSFCFRPNFYEVYSSITEIEDKYYDYIVTAVKSNDSESTEKDIRENLKGTFNKIVLMQNGWGNFEIFSKQFESKKIFNARVITGFTRPELNVSEITVHADYIKIGSVSGESEESIRDLAEAIDRGGIPCITTSEIVKDLWAKMLYNCALNPVGAIFGVNYGGLENLEHSREIMKNIVDEIFDVMSAKGYKTYWDKSEEYLKFFYDKLLPPTREHFSSTLQDIRAGKRTEIEALNGQIVKLGEEAGVNVKVNRTIVQMIKFMEENKR
jgi:2-dehydropantoate 2-reductase